MSDRINEELSQLASEFTTARESEKKNRYPESIWKKAIIIANKLSIPVVCEAINVNPAYFRKKLTDFDSKSSESLNFIEIPQRNCESITALTIKIETPGGNKLMVEGANTSCLIPIINEFMRRGTPCFK